MRAVTFIILLFSCIPNSTFAQSETNPQLDTIDQILVVDNYSNEDGFILYLPIDQCEGDTLDLIVFLHGYGAINPMVYGGWIEHLVSKGNAVLYPRYQMSMFTTSTDDFVPNTVNAINSAYGLAENCDYHLNPNTVDMIGHSYGGVIAGNLAATYMDNGIPAPRLVMLCEPGSGPLSGAVLDSYEGINNEIILVIVVGDKDYTVGQKLGLIVYETATKNENRMLFWQFEDEHEEENIGASHYEPYSYDSRFDNDIENFTVKRAKGVSHLDQVDFYGYWQTFNLLQKHAIDGAGNVDTILIDQMSNLGKWSDGTPVKAMEWRQGGK